MINGQENITAILAVRKEKQEDELRIWPFCPEKTSLKRCDMMRGLDDKKLSFV